MKKIVCAYIALCIITSCAFAAPYRWDYLSSSKYRIAELFDTIAQYGWNAESKNTVATDDTENVAVTPQKQPAAIRHISDVAGGIAVVSQVASGYYNGDSVLKVTYYINNSTEARVCYFDSDSHSTGGRFTYENLNAGSLVYIGVDSEGVVDEYCVVSVFNKSNGLPEIDLSAAKAEFSSDKIQFTYSYILDYDSRDGNVSVDLINGESIDAPDGSNQYTIEPQRKSTVIHSGDCLRGDVYTAEYDEQLDKTVVYPILSVSYKDEAVFTCSYSTPVYLDGNILE